jgi:DNA polymerase III alpha subunit (gram-positive type)
MCRLKIVFCNFGLVVKLAPLAVKSVFACYHYADYLSTVTVNVSQNIKEKIKRGEYVDLASLLTNNQHNDSKQKLILQQGELILQPDQNNKKLFSIDTWTTYFGTHLQ